MNKQAEKMATDMADMVIAALESGKGAAWQKPWNDSYFGNPVTGNFYNGYNPLLLGLYNHCHGYTQPYFITVGSLVSIAKKVGKFLKVDDTKKYGYISWYSKIEKQEKDANGENVTISFPVLQIHRVYNIQQIEGWETIFADDIVKMEGKREAIAPLPEIDTFFKTYIEKSGIEFDGQSTRASFTPSKNKINMPPRERFLSVGGYYSTLWHEVGHATGLPLKRFSANDFVAFGDDVYSREELTAEGVASMLGGMFGFADDSTVKNSEAYLAGWAKALKADKTILFKAFQDSSRAVAHILKTVGTETV
jgi:antirestriction protein ArdC